MVAARAFRVPRIRVPTVTTPTHIRFEPDSVPCVVTLVEALLANDTRGVFLAILTFPRDVARLQSLATNAHRLETLRQMENLLAVVFTTVKQCVEHVKVGVVGRLFFLGFFAGHPLGDVREHLREHPPIFFRDTRRHFEVIKNLFINLRLLLVFFL